MFLSLHPYTVEASPGSHLRSARRALELRAAEVAGVRRDDVYGDALLASFMPPPPPGGAVATTDAEAEMLCSSAMVSAALDHLSFERLGAMMSRHEPAGTETHGIARQVVIVSRGLDTRPFRLPWPKGTAIFELAHRDVHQHAAMALKEVKAKVARGCSHRRVPVDVVGMEFEYGDVEDALERAGYAADVRSLWLLLDVQSADQAKWAELVEEVGDCMCTGSEVLGEVPKDEGVVRSLERDMAVAGILAQSFAAPNPEAREEQDGEGARGGGALMFHGIKQKPSRKEVEYYREQLIMAQDGADEDGFED